LGLVARGGPGLQRQNAAAGQGAPAVVADEMEKMEQGARLRVLGHKGAAALAAHDQIGLGDVVQRPAHGALAHAEAGGKGGLGRQFFARPPNAAAELLHQSLFGARIERQRAGEFRAHSLL